MKYIYLAILITVTAACKKNEIDLVENFFSEIKANGYEGVQETPPFRITHIDALLQHASDEQLISRFPWAPVLSYFPGQQEVGFVMLYAIEVIRDPGDYPLRGALVVDTDDRERDVTLGEVLPRYQAWWSEHKGKSAAQLRQLNPLEGTGLVWFGTEVSE